MDILDELFEGTGILGLNIKNKFRNAKKEISSVMQKESDYREKKADKEERAQLDSDIESIMKENYGIKKNAVVAGMGVCIGSNVVAEKESPMKITIKKKLKEFEDLVKP